MIDISVGVYNIRVLAVAPAQYHGAWIRLLGLHMRNMHVDACELLFKALSMAAVSSAVGKSSCVRKVAAMLS